MSERSWTIDDSGAALEILAPDGTSICMVHNTDRPDDEYGDPAPETLANAHLLAAAPALLSALRELLEYADNGAPVYPGALVWDDVRAAIASATGKDFRVSERTAGTYYSVKENVYSHETKQDVAYCFSTADATFLAAAPDLLEALKGCWAALEELIADMPMLAARIAGSTTVGNHRAAAKAAIAKATGNVREECGDHSRTHRPGYERMCQHTAGPWIVGTDNQPENEIWIEADGPNVLAAVW